MYSCIYTHTHMHIYTQTALGGAPSIDPQSSLWSFKQR